MESMDATRLLEGWAAAWSSGDVQQVLALFVDDCTYEDVTLGAVNHGQEELKAFGDIFFAAAPDLKVELISTWAAGDRAAAEWRMSGTHKGDLPGMPATGREFAFRGMSAFELRGDRLSRCSDYWDMATLMRTLGFLS